ncbi:hypothetical protein I4U23_015508 [Adineta vaga]|nr:hypothetical protein I4U23_015508 [Adineta vaga]
MNVKSETIIQMTNESSNTNVNESNSSDVLLRLIKAHKKESIQEILLITIITVVCTVGSIICFVVGKVVAERSEVLITLLTLGGILSAKVLFLLLILCYGINYYRVGFRWMNYAQYIIYLDGELWQKQVDSLRKIIHSKRSRLCCRSTNSERFPTHTSGHIVLAKEGIIIDDFLIFKYEKFVIYRLDVMDGTAGTDVSLRLLLCPDDAVPTEGFPDRSKEKEFELYLFLEPFCQTQELMNIRDSILANAEKCLNATGYFRHTHSSARSNSFSF